MLSVRTDPTRLGTLRRQFEKKINSFFSNLEKSIYNWMVKENELGLTTNKERYKFESNPAKLDAYKAWLLEQVQQGFLRVDNQSEPWLSEYIDSAHKRGVLRAYDDVAKQVEAETGQLEDVIGSKKFFERRIFGAPIVQERVKLLHTRAFEELKGVTEFMAKQMSNSLAFSLANGIGSREAARNLQKEAGLAKSRALRVARTELVYAYAEGQLDSFDTLGIEDLGVMIEWVTAGDDRVCPRCQAQAGRKFTKTSTARGLIPFHPNCRCAWVPVVDVQKILENPNGFFTPKGVPTGDQSYSGFSSSNVKGRRSNVPAE